MDKILEIAASKYYLSAMKIFLKSTLTLFLIICIGVHLYGLIDHFSNEANWSHVIHLISYTLCLFFFTGNLKFRLYGYGIAMLYPFAYHTVCLETTFAEHHTVQPVCMLVVILLPAIFVWMGYEKRFSASPKQ